MKEKKLVFAVDFDGTLCTNAYPCIGEPCHEIINWIKKLRNDGHKIILWTCRDGMRLVDAIVWCADQGLFFDTVNDNLESHKKLYKGNSRKILADFYIDDKAIYPTDIELLMFTVPLPTPEELNPMNLYA